MEKKGTCVCKSPHHETTHLDRSDFVDLKEVQTRTLKMLGESDKTDPKKLFHRDFLACLKIAYQ